MSSLAAKTRHRLEKGRLAGVRVLKLSAWPAETAGVPRSFAVSGAARWERVSRAVLPLGWRWRRAHSSRWEFSFRLPAGALCLGLGENISGRLNLRSRTWTLFATDDCLHVETMEAMYKAIPFLIVFAHGQATGYFLDTPARQVWNLDMELEGRGGIELLSRRGWSLYAFGPAPLPALLQAYTELTGRSRLPPLWSLGHQQSRWSYPDEKTVRDIARQFRSRKIPCDTIVLDIDYMDGYRVFTTSKKSFPRFRQLMRDLKRDDFKVVTIIDPGVKKDSRYSIYREGAEKGMFCRKSDGRLFVDKVWPGDALFPDFLRDDVRAWWGKKQDFLRQQGVAGVWNDMNEPALFNNQRVLPKTARELPPDSRQLFLQQAPEGKVGHFEVRNLYGFQMARASCEGLLKHAPEERPFVLTRSAYAGIQRYAAVWLGDNYSWFDHLAKSIPMLLNMSLSGVPFCGVDVGGFLSDTVPELLVRWYETGIFYPFFRNHCALNTRHQEPWVFGKKVEQLCRRLIETRYRLLPYLQSLFWEHLRTGAPIMRPLLWHYPRDSHALETDDEFLFGRDILVAPILERGRTRRNVYLPSGIWHPFEGGRPLAGGRVHNVAWPLGTVPAFVRDGAILPLARPVPSTAKIHRAPITFTCFGDRAEGVFFEEDGSSFDYELGRYNEWKLQLRRGHLEMEPLHLGLKGLQCRCRAKSASGAAIRIRS